MKFAVYGQYYQESYDEILTEILSFSKEKNIEVVFEKSFAEMISNREVHLAEIKRRQDEYQASRGNALTGGATKAATPAKGDYNF